MQNNLSKYCLTVPITSISVTTVAHAIAKNLFSQYGALKAIRTNGGGSFVNNLLTKSSKIFEIKQVTSSGYRVQLNRSIERSHAVLINYIRSCAETYENWDQLSAFAMFAYNTLIHEATKFTLLGIVFGKTTRTSS